MGTLKRLALNFAVVSLALTMGVTVASAHMIHSNDSGSSHSTGHRYLGSKYSGAKVQFTNVNTEVSFPATLSFQVSGRIDGHMKRLHENGTYMGNSIYSVPLPDFDADQVVTIRGTIKMKEHGVELKYMVLDQIAYAPVFE